MFNNTFDVNPSSQGLFAKDEADRLALPALALSYPYHGYANVALAGGAAETADLPGPSAGYVRLYTSVYAVSNTIDTGLTSVSFTLEPGTYTLTAALTSTATMLGVTIVPPIGVGETIRATNGGAGAGRIVGTYIDIPATGITLIRTQVDATGVTIVPAAPTGYVNRLFQHTTSSTSISGFRWWNADAVTQSLEVLVDGTLVSRSAPALTTAVGAISGPLHVPVTSGAMTMRCTTAVDTTGPWVIWAYETMPLVA